MSPENSRQPRVLMLGSESAFSGVVLRRLLESDTNLCGLVIHEFHPPARAFEPKSDEIPVVVADTGPGIAATHGVPLILFRSMHDRDLLKEVQDLEPDFLLVACFPYLLDDAWLAVPGEMCFNLHPSLLPSYRGPTPLFWQLRKGEHETGITLHVVEMNVDAGDILAQSALPLSAGVRFSEINAQLAELGAELVLDTLAKLAAGITVPRTMQEETLASYQPFPKEEDFRFDTHFTAERAYRFIQGTQEWGLPFEVDAGDAVLILERALDYHDDARMAVPYEINADQVRIRFSEGVLEAIGRRADDD